LDDRANEEIIVDREVQAFAQVMAILVPSIVILAATAVVLMKVSRKSMLPPPARPSRIDDDRFERLEQAVDSIAIEVERISESQRFSAKLLAERVKDEANSERASRPSIS
jgi:hypothetical protein